MKVLFGMPARRTGTALTRGQIFNPGSGLGPPDLAALAADFGRR